jgi:predicted Fe-Mo cluster-binding NifX family protein
MKIAVASNDGKKISAHFGRTKGFVIFEIENGEIKSREYRLNTFTGHARGFSHDDPEHHKYTHPAIIEALKDCKVVISHGMGRRLYDDLTSAGIDVYVTDETDVDKAIELYLKGELTNVSELLD